MIDRSARSIHDQLGERASPREPGFEAHRRRVVYFMLFRLVLILAFTLLVAWTTWLRSDYVPGPREWLAWSTVASGYVLTLAFAGALRRATRLRALVWAQTGFDILLASAAVLLTGGAASSFVFLFLIAILGAATMGDRRLIWAAASACASVYVLTSIAQAIGGLELYDEGGMLVELQLGDLWVGLLRNGAAMVLVATLSGYLNNQLLSSVSQVGNLRALNDNIVRSLSSGLLTIDQDARVLFANPTAYELLGLRGEAFGLESEVLLPGLAGHLDDSGGFRNRFELTLRRASDGREIELGLTSSALIDEHGHFLGHVVHFQDVTELRKMERILRRNERLTAIGELAASVAHEIRNPLAAISGCAELLEGQVQGDENERLLRVIQRETTRMANIVTELLDYTRPRVPVRAELDLRRNLEELAESFRADRNHAEIELVLSLPEQPVLASIDAAQLGQVLWNLVRNAVQAMEGKGRVELGVAGVEGEVRLSVRDHGHGIAAENIDRIFEPFFSTKTSGSGIGLALVHRIVEAHGGQIDVHSVVGEGTQFVIRLPR
ncbi:two-component system sensor histidine kinase NtrB [Nannocystaceae bacterium ST9]